MSEFKSYIFPCFFDICRHSLRKISIIMQKIEGGDETMRKIHDYMMRKRGILNVFMVIGAMTAMMAREGFCFFIYHQPEFPDALKDKE